MPLHPPRGVRVRGRAVRDSPRGRGDVAAGGPTDMEKAQKQWCYACRDEGKDNKHPYWTCDHSRERRMKRAALGKGKG